MTEVVSYCISIHSSLNISDPVIGRAHLHKPANYLAERLMLGCANKMYAFPPQRVLGYMRDL